MKEFLVKYGDAIATVILVTTIILAIANCVERHNVSVSWEISPKQSAEVGD